MPRQHPTSPPPPSLMSGAPEIQISCCVWSPRDFSQGAGDKLIPVGVPGIPAAWSEPLDLFFVLRVFTGHLFAGHPAMWFMYTPSSSQQSCELRTKLLHFAGEEPEAQGGSDFLRLHSQRGYGGVCAPPEPPPLSPPGSLTSSLNILPPGHFSEVRYLASTPGAGPPLWHSLPGSTGLSSPGSPKVLHPPSAPLAPG